MVAELFCTLAVITCEPKVEVEIVKNEIVRQAEIYNVDVNKALAIAKCESEFIKTAKNKNSSATGVYQYIDSTWDYFCKGDRLNHISNIRCFMQMYPRYPTYWECHKKLYGKT